MGNVNLDDNNGTFYYPDRNITHFADGFLPTNIPLPPIFDNFEKRGYGLALLHIPNDITFNDHVKPVNLPPDDFDYQIKGEVVELSGYSFKEEFGNKIVKGVYCSQLFSESIFKIRRECHKVPEIPDGPYLRGTPVYITDIPFLHGISVGYSIIARVDYHLEWIRDITGINSGN